MRFERTTLTLARRTKAREIKAISFLLSPIARTKNKEIANGAFELRSRGRLAR